MTRDIRHEVPRDRFVLVHYHIFKNAGSTIDYALARSFGDAFATVHGTHDDARLFGEDIVAVVQAEPTLKALSSHHVRHPKPVARGIEFFDLALVRHPLARARSLYTYGRRIGASSWLGNVAMQHDERGFVAHLVEHAPQTLADAQARLLVHGGLFDRALGARDLEAAQTLIAGMTVPGVVECLDEALVTAEYYLRPCFPMLDFAYTPQNVSAPGGAPPALGDIDAACRAAWGEALRATMVALNSVDLALHAFTQAEVRRRLATVPDADARLSAFRARCAALADAG